MGPVEEMRWVNPHQPQTLYMAVILCYIEGVVSLFSFPTFGVFALIVLVGLVAGGFGVANEKRWGYLLALGTAIFQVLIVLLVYRTIADIGVLIQLAFDILLVVLLAHPMSRSYQRIWFK
jgi:hypothetical protein